MADPKETRHEKRELTWSDQGKALERFSVTRWRDNSGNAGIDCRVLKYADSGGNEYAEFSFSKSFYGDEYEQVAKQFLAALDSACDEPCLVK